MLNVFTCAAEFREAWQNWNLAKSTNVQQTGTSRPQITKLVQHREFVLIRIICFVVTGLLINYVTSINFCVVNKPTLDYDQQTAVYYLRKNTYIREHFIVEYQDKDCRTFIVGKSIIIWQHFCCSEIKRKKIGRAFVIE